MMLYFDQNLAQEPIHKKSHYCSEDPVEVVGSSSFYVSNPLLSCSPITFGDIDFNTITDKSFAHCYSEATITPCEDWFPTTCIPEIQSIPVIRDVPRKPVSIKIASENTDVDNGGLPRIFRWQRFTYHGRFVLIKRFGIWQVHHWIDPHSRSVDKAVHDVRGHYRIGRS
jgi:hypothetical protein